MAIYGNPSTNKVYVNWKKPNEKKTTYYKKYNGKRLGFIGSESSLKDAKEIKDFRKRYNKTTKIVKLGGEYLLYSH